MAISEQPKEHYTDKGITVCTGEDCEICLDRKFDVWFLSVRQELCHTFGWDQQAINSIDASAWKEFFDEGFSPEEAIIEDLTSC